MEAQNSTQVGLKPVQPLEARAPRVLVCDDSAVIRTLMITLLEPEHVCLGTESAERALESLAEFAPDLIISDLVMEGMSGYELCRFIRAEPTTADIPVILLTGETDREARAQGLELGADDFLYKPIRPRELLARVSSLLKLRQATTSLKLRTHELEEANRVLQRTQAALVHSEKLATVGTLAAGVAHEVNNPLAFMKGGIHATLDFLTDLEATWEGEPESSQGLITKQRPLVEELRQIGKEISDGLIRIERIVRDLKDFSATRNEEYEMVNLGAELERAWKLASMKAKSSVTFSFECAEPVIAPAVPTRIGQVFLNIMLNAVQAIGANHGKVTASLTREDGHAVVVLGDDGPGIPEAIASRIFDPFFTTKEPGQGTGLGLSVTYGIIDRMGGTIGVRSAPGEGAAFTIKLPLERAEPAPGNPAAALGTRKTLTGFTIGKSNPSLRVG